VCTAGARNHPGCHHHLDFLHSSSMSGESEQCKVTELAFVDPI
jgi:hypothetical protein